MPVPNLPFRILDAANVQQVGFLLWKGPAPSFVTSQINTPARPGFRNFGMIDTGKRSPAVDVEVISWHADLAAGYDMHEACCDLIGVVPLLSLEWNELDLDAFDQKIALLAVTISELKMHPRLYAPKWELNFAPGARLVQRLKIQYFDVS